jgi:hypothetical protein
VTEVRCRGAEPKAPLEIPVACLAVAAATGADEASAACTTTILAAVRPEWVRDARSWHIDTTNTQRVVCADFAH